MKSSHRAADLGGRGYAALLLDLDGTLVGKSGKVSARVVQAVGRVAKELPVSIATGRPPAEVITFARQLALTSPQICDGGALILDPARGQPIWSIPLPPGHA